MERKFADGAKVRMCDTIIASAPAYAGRTYTVKAASAAWEIGARNEWYGDYVIEDENGHKAVTSQHCLVLA